MHDIEIAMSEVEPAIPNAVFDPSISIPNQIKMVIWDLDDTFWEGTLSEEGICPIPKNIQIVKTLTERGIVSSISSKNDYAEAKAKLEAFGIWDYFVFPKIEFTSKGAGIALIIDQANLRPDNILFIDDNPINLRELKFSLPKIMTADPLDILPLLLDLPQAKGKDDSSLSRLNQYKQLEFKVADMAQSTMDNSDFLRNCDIRVELLYEIDAYKDRIIELINRSNQLNYTKKRVESPVEVEAFNKALNSRDAHAGIVKASDKYGDYGVVGFFLMIQDSGVRRLDQFVFSCRAMNMGVEQYVYEHLGSPDCVVVPPVANPICAFDAVDWISSGNGDGRDYDQSNEKLVLIGGCDLMQVASYCSKNRAEYVNIVRNDIVIRYDDFGFIANSRDKLATSRTLPTIPCWNSQEALNFDKDLSDSDMVIVSLWVALRGKHLVTDDGLVVRVHPHGLGDYLDANPDEPYLTDSRIFELDAAQNAALLTGSLTSIAERSPKATYRVILGCNTRRVDGVATAKDLESRVQYNRIAKAFAAQTSLFDFISLDDLVPKDELVDDWHLSRMGYHRLATEVLARKASQAWTKTLEEPRPSDDILAIVASGRPLRRGASLGPELSAFHRVKRGIRSLPGGNLAVSALKVVRKSLK